MLCTLSGHDIRAARLAWGCHLLFPAVAASVWAEHTLSQPCSHGLWGKLLWTLARRSPIVRCCFLAKETCTWRLFRQRNSWNSALWKLDLLFSLIRSCPCHEHKELCYVSSSFCSFTLLFSPQNPLLCSLNCDHIPGTPGRWGRMCAWLLGFSGISCGIASQHGDTSFLATIFQVVVWGRGERRMGQGEDLEESVDGRVVLCSLLFLSQVHRDFKVDLLPRWCPIAGGIQPGQGASWRWGWAEHSHHCASAATGVEACRERAHVMPTWRAHSTLAYSSEAKGLCDTTAVSVHAWKSAPLCLCIALQEIQDWFCCLWPCGQCRGWVSRLRWLHVNFHLSIDSCCPWCCLSPWGWLVPSRGWRFPPVSSQVRAVFLVCPSHLWLTLPG